MRKQYIISFDNFRHYEWPTGEISYSIGSTIYCYDVDDTCVRLLLRVITSFETGDRRIHFAVYIFTFFFFLSFHRQPRLNSVEYNYNFNVTFNSYFFIIIIIKILTGNRRKKTVVRKNISYTNIYCDLIFCFEVQNIVNLYQSVFVFECWAVLVFV